MTKLNATFRRMGETEQIERAAYRRGATIAKYLFLTACGFALYYVGSVLALAERGYEAMGGEVLLLLFPLFYYAISDMVRDVRREIKTLRRKMKMKHLYEIEAGTRFRYGGVNWLVLGRSSDNTGGVLCLAEKVLFNKAFDDDNYNNWEDSSLREQLNNDFLEKLVQSGAAEAAFMPMVTDLTADDGLKDYGSCEDTISLISCYQYRQYRGIIPNADNWWWTCTAYSTKANGYSCYARVVYYDGTLLYSSACCGGGGVRPLCTIKSGTLVSKTEVTENE